MKKILIIEDDIWIWNSLKLYLENSNFLVDIEINGNNAIKKIKNYEPNLIILDLNLPWKWGIEITKEYRENWEIPIIMLTARSSEIDRIKGLEIWADDYISKPFSPRELLARIKTILRRTGETEENKNVLKFEDLHIDLEKNKVSKQDKEISLTANEFEILKTLIEKNWWILTRTEIMKEVMWYENYIYDRTVDTHMKNLRKKLAPWEYILTIRGTWYRLNT